MQYKQVILDKINCSNYWMDTTGIIWNIKKNIWAKEDITNVVHMRDDNNNKVRYRKQTLYRIAFEKDFLFDPSEPHTELSEYGLPECNLTKSNKLYNRYGYRVKAPDVHFPYSKTRRIYVSKLIRMVNKNYIRDIPSEDKRCLDFLGYPNYQLVRDGRLWSTNLIKWKKSFLHHHGYLSVGLNNKEGKANIHLHKLLALTFIPIPKHLKDIPFEKLHVHHKDENKLNNNIINDPEKGLKCNLEWIEGGIHSANHNTTISDDMLLVLFTNNYHI